jgi:hypothetical protein
LAQLLDQRARSGDLYASALEFAAEPARYGWLGELTCRQAGDEARHVALVPQWSFGAWRHWAAMATVAVILGGTYGARVGLDRLGSGRSVGPTAGAEMPDSPAAGGKAIAQRQPPDEPAAKEKTPPGLPSEPEETKPEKPADETVKITNEMIDRYLQQVPEQEKVSLDGATPIRWDEDEAGGKNNPQNREEGKKIDPVKLDAAFLKDLEAAKKTKTEGGAGDSAVDIAVMGKQDQGAAAKGKTGGKEGKESLADASSKDPRGNPTRLAVKPARNGLQITSAARARGGHKGQVRPMGLLEFLAAMKRSQTTPAEPPAETASPPAGPAPERVTPQEPAPDTAARLIESYFDRLRRADQ